MRVMAHCGRIELLFLVDQPLRLRMHFPGTAEMNVVYILSQGFNKPASTSISSSS